MINFIIAIVVLSTCLIISSYFAVKFAIIIARVEEGIEHSLDILDKEYASVSLILERPLFFDSAEIRSVVSSLKRSHDAILRTAQEMSASIVSEEIETEEAD